VRHDYAQGFSDPFTDCSGNECSLIRSELARDKAREDKRPHVSIIKAEPEKWWAYHPPRILFVPNSCTHDYGIFFEWELPAPPRQGA
jgi:hypothetical protein